VLACPARRLLHSSAVLAASRKSREGTHPGPLGPSHTSPFAFSIHGAGQSGGLCGRTSTWKNTMEHIPTLSNHEDAGRRPLTAEFLGSIPTLKAFEHLWSQRNLHKPGDPRATRQYSILAGCSLGSSPGPVPCPKRRPTACLFDMLR